MARPPGYPPPRPSRSKYVAVRLPDGEIDWDKTRLDRPLPCYLHPAWAAPEVGTCLHRLCLGPHLLAQHRGVIGEKLRILKAGYKLAALNIDDMIDDIALELLDRYKKFDVPVTYAVSSLLTAVMNAGTRRWGRRCWESDWLEGAGRTTLEDALEDVQTQLDDLATTAWERMADPMTHDPLRVLRNLELAAVASSIPRPVFAHILGELTAADMIRLGYNARAVSRYAAVLREKYLDAA